MELLPRTEDYLARRDARIVQLRADSAALLAGSKPCTLEIGCGHGHFLTAYAKAHPERVCVGIDIMLDRVTRAERKRTRSELPNLHFIRAEAREFLSSLPETARIDTYLILFPDPWPKRRHHKNRIIQPDFLSTLARQAGEGARLCFRTDHVEYFRDAFQTITEHSDWKIVNESPWPFEFETVFQSRAPAFQSIVAHLRGQGPAKC